MTPPGSRNGGAKSPRVSIILNAYNGAAFLKETLESIFAQTFRDWELIFWDDQSTDDTAAIFRAAMDDRCRYFLAPEFTNLGEARRLAIAEARGEWLAFIDQDDLWSPDKLQRQIAVIDEDGGADLGLVYGRAITFTSGGRESDFDHRHEFGSLPEGDIFAALFRDACFIPMSASLIRTSAYHEVGGIPPGYTAAIDYWIFIAVSRRYRARALQEPCCWYRVHASNMTQSHLIPLHQEALRILDAWKNDIDPRVYRYRHAVHSTLMGLEEVFGLHAVGRGLKRIIIDGSFSYLATRPFARGWRALRRKVAPRHSAAAARST